MAIVQSSLADEILSRQERAVLRGIYRASQLSDALVALSKIKESVMIMKTEEKVSISSEIPVTELRAFLVTAILSALASTKVPVLPSLKMISSEPKE